MNHDDVLYGLACRYKDRFRLLYDSRMTPGTTGWLLSRLAHFVQQAARDYLNAGGSEETITSLERQVQQERRPVSHEPIWEFLSRDEPETDWAYRGETPTYGTPLNDILAGLENEDGDDD